MRIDIRSSDSPQLFSLPTRSGGLGGQDVDFQQALARALDSPLSPLAASVSLKASFSPPSTPVIIPHTSHAIQTQEREKLEERLESYKEDLRESSELMERVVENWEKQAPGEEEVNLEPDTDNTEELLQELQEDAGADLVDDMPDMILDFESGFHGTPDHSLDSQSAESEKKAPHSLLKHDPLEAQEREMSYAEIQHLVNSVLQGGPYLSCRLQCLLSKVLESLAQGYRYPLDQHTLLDLESQEWQTLFSLFPARFFQGLIRPLFQEAQENAHIIQAGYDLLEAVLYQKGLNLEQFDLLEKLWNRLIPLPRMFMSWLRQPELPTLSLADLQYPLEILQQHQALLPGAVGHIQSLALHFLHHAEIAVHLLEISRNCLHGIVLSGSQIELLSEKLADFCFSHTLDGQMAPLLARALEGHDLESEEIIRILQGAPQKILSHLPFAQLTPALQEIIQFIHTNPEYNEENILSLFLENESQLCSGS